MFNPAELNVIGKPIPKVDALPRCTGKLQYADDLTFPEMLFCKIYRSPYAHAFIKKIDLSKAKKIPGVVKILTGEDFSIPFGILPVSQDEYPLSNKEVRYVGEPIAAFAALDEESAYQAAKAISIEFEIVKPSMSIEESLKQGMIHKSAGLEFGDIEKGFLESDDIFENVYFYEGNTHLALEEHAAAAVPDPDGKLTLYSSTQVPHYLHRTLAKTLNLPPSRIRVIASPNGGGFGGKSDVFSHEIVVSKLALLTGKPVKISLTREEIFYLHRGRHPTLMWLKTGVKKDGTISSMHFKSLLDGGAYGSYGVASLYYTGALQTTTYKIENYKFEGARLFTHKAPCGPKRGHGTPQPRFAIEIMLDEISEKLQIDPAELRKKHLVQSNSITPNYLKVGSMGLGKCIDKVVEGSGWKDKFRKLPYGKGVGLACGSYICGAGLPIYWNPLPHSSVMIKLDRGGGVSVYCGQIDIGQGSNSMLAQVIAEILGVGPSEIKLCCADTDLTPVDLGSYSSRVTLMVGNAAIQAAQKAVDLLKKAVSEKWGISEDKINFKNGKAFNRENPDLSLDFSEAVQLAEAKFGAVCTVGSYTPPKSPGEYKGAGVGPSPAYSYSASVVQVEVDPETGIIQIEKVWIAHDIGKAINPLSVIGQVEGSVYMGLGEALMEEQTFRARYNGVHKAPGMLDYKSLTSKDMPEVETYLIEDPDPNGPYGAKEVGQGPLLPIPPAVANAVYDAIGVRIREIPLHPEKVLFALKNKAPKRSFPSFHAPKVIRVPLPSESPNTSLLSSELLRSESLRVDSSPSSGLPPSSSGAVSS